MTLVTCLLDCLKLWENVFPQKRTFHRAITLSFGILGAVGKRTLTRAITVHGNTQKDWSADFKLFSRSPWDPQDLFDPILAKVIQIQKQPLSRIVVSVDDTRVWRTGKKVPNTQWHRDPLGPAFHTNLRWGHRFLHASCVLPFYEGNKRTGSRTIPIRWEMAPVIKKPGKRAPSEQWDQYHKEKKEHNLSKQFVRLATDLRRHLNETGQKEKVLSLVVDGSYCNQTVFGQDWQKDNVSLIARCRKDLLLCHPAQEQGPRVYAQEKFTPEQVRENDERFPWQETYVFHGGCLRKVRYKEVSKVLWQRGGKTRLLRVLVVAPVGYRTSKNGRKYYRQPAYLLTTDLTTAAAVLLQEYFDRWGIEVNHRDEKEILGVGDAQVWNPNSVTKVPALMVAMYSWLLLSGITCYGSTRTEDYLLLPKWRKGAKSPSCLDLIALLRKQLAENPPKFITGSIPLSYRAMVQGAAA
jgi:hypothetical protein